MQLLNWLSTISLLFGEKPKRSKKMERLLSNLDRLGSMSVENLPKRFRSIIDIAIANNWVIKEGTSTYASYRLTPMGKEYLDNIMSR